MSTTLVTARFDGALRSRLEELCGPAVMAGYGVTGQVMEPADFRGLLGSVETLITEFEVMDEAAFDAAPHLRIVLCCRNEPHASVDLPAASARGIPVLFTPGRNARAVAEFTIGLMLAGLRNIAESHHALKYTEQFTAAEASEDARLDTSAQWGLEPGDPFDVFAGHELSGRTLGLVGCGAIGGEIATLASALGMTVIVHDPFLSPERADSLGVRPVVLDELAALSDVVAIAAKVTPQTRGLIGREFLDRMKPSGYLVNTARAAIVDYDALHDALLHRRLRGAALDVHPKEPLPSASKFRALDNVVLTPHLAGATFDVVTHHTRIALAELERVVAGGSPRFCANPDVLALANRRN